MVTAGDSEVLNPVLEEVKFHSRVKHKFIEKYLDIYSTNIVQNAQKNNRKPVSLQIFDMYAAKGWCHCEDCEVHNVGEKQWEGSALLAAKCIGSYPNNYCKLFLNSWHEDPQACEIQFNALKGSLNDYFERYPGLMGKTTLSSKNIIDAVTEAKPLLDKDYPSLWLLDPYDPKQLPWNAIQEIGSMQSERHKVNGKFRKPEMIITFMTSYLQRFAELQPRAAEIALGIPEEEWKPKLIEYDEKYGNKREAFLRLFYDRLGEIYEKEPVAMLVKDITNRAIVYCVILCSDHNAGHYMSRVKMKELDKWHVDYWGQEAIKLKTKMSGQQLLGDF